MGVRLDAGPLPLEAIRPAHRCKQGGAEKALGTLQVTAPDFCTKAAHFNPEDFSDCHQLCVKHNGFSGGDDDGDGARYF